MLHPSSRSNGFYVGLCIRPQPFGGVYATNLKDQAIQIGILVGILYNIQGTSEKKYHIVDWVSRKQRRVRHSSYGAEVLACADTDDRGYNLKMAMTSLFLSYSFRHVLNVDSKRLYDTVTTLYEGRD